MFSSLPLLLLCFLGTCYGSGLFSKLERTLEVTASTKHGDVLKVGENTITVTWKLNHSFPSSTAKAYKTVKVQLCFAPISQKDRAWRKTSDELSIDKTCQYDIVKRPYESNRVQSFVWTIERNTPTATYFVRPYPLDCKGHEVAYGETTDSNKNTNLFHIKSISGRHKSIDIAAGCFSGFSILSLFFFYIEKKKGNRDTSSLVGRVKTCISRKCWSYC